MTVCGGVVGVYLPSCYNNDMCSLRGTYCCIDCENTKDRCNFCGFASPLAIEYLPDGTTLNHSPDAGFAGFNMTAVTELCTAPIAAVGPTPQQSDGNKGGYPAKAVEAWCDACVKASGHVDPSQPLKVAKDNAQAMGLFDWATYGVASYVVALTLVGELKDIMLVARAVSMQSLSTFHVAPLLTSFEGRWSFSESSDCQ